MFIIIGRTAGRPVPPGLGNREPVNLNTFHRGATSASQDWDAFKHNDIEQKYGRLFVKGLPKKRSNKKLHYMHNFVLQSQLRF